MKRYVSPLLMLVIATFVMAPGWAQAGSGFYHQQRPGRQLCLECGIRGRQQRHRQQL